LLDDAECRFWLFVRSEKAKEEVLKSEVEGEHVLSSSHPYFMQDLERTARELGTTAVFDGVGGALVSKMLGALPPRSSIFFYGSLSGAEKVKFPSAVFMMKDFTMRRFSNFNTMTVKERLGDMLKDLEGCIGDPLFRTTLGRDFEPKEIEAAMEYEGGSKKAILMFTK
jgi:NADPH:quinone reductase-like Zn-dependent oxidoreductase